MSKLRDILNTALSVQFPFEFVDEAIAELDGIIKARDMALAMNDDLAKMNQSLIEQNAHLSKMLKLYEEHSDRVYKAVMNKGIK